MTRIARVWAALMLIFIGLGVAGCIHTWTQTYDDFPPDAINRPHERQLDPSDG